MTCGMLTPILNMFGVLLIAHLQGLNTSTLHVYGTMGSPGIKMSTKLDASILRTVKRILPWLFYWNIKFNERMPRRKTAVVQLRVVAVKYMKTA